MSLYKGFEYPVNLESLGVVDSDHCKIRGQVLIHFISEKNRSASALVISRVQTTTRR